MLWKRRSGILALVLLTLVLAVNLVVRIRLLDAPLERDEGEHAYMAQTMLRGYAPWQLAYNMKLPGTDAAYAAFMAVLGESAVAIRLGLLLINTATVLLMLLLGRRLFGLPGGAAAGAAYCVLSFSQSVFGTMAHAPHFVVFFAVMATLVLLHPSPGVWRVFASGLLYGLAFLMKQPGIWFGVFGALYVAWLCRRGGKPLARALARLAVFGAGVLLPYALLCLALWRAGVFARFWFWTVTLARAYAGQLPVADRITYFARGFPGIVGPNLFLWLLAGCGVLAASRNPPFRRAGRCTAALLAFSFLGVCTGNVFYPHYFILMLPAVALACGGLVASGFQPLGPRREELRSRESASPPSAGPSRWLNALPLGCIALACLCSVYAQRDYLFRMSPDEFSRATYGLNPFPEAVEVGSYIRTHSEPGARIAVLGSEAEIYFYAHRQAATGYLFTYGLMERHQYAAPSQDDMIREIEAARPAYIVFVGVPTSWLVQPGSTQTVFQWASGYVRQYEVVGIIDILSGRPAIYKWGFEAAAYRPVSPARMVVYRRK